MKKEIGISETEWIIMEILWDKPMLTIGEIRSCLNASEWSDSTLKTLVRRLVIKNAVGYDDTKGHFRYFPIADEKECRLKETKSFIDKVYHGSVKLMMASLVSDKGLSREETEKLFEIIDKMED